jgi:putative transcriptional regulator
MSASITRHPDGATLMSYSAGSLSEPLAAAVSAHVWMCTECHDAVRDLDLVGASLLEAAVAPGGALRAPATAQSPRQREASVGAAAGRGGELPAPIARKYRLALDEIPWKALGPGIWRHGLGLSPGAKGELYLLKLTPGRRLPLHGHAGTELTVVITGAFSDATGRYRRGDVQESDTGVEHQPVGDGNEGCICLIAAEGPYLLKG